MGTSNTKVNSRQIHAVNSSVSEFSLAGLIGKLSFRSFASVNSVPTTYSVSRPWPRISRRGWRENTLNNPLECQKTTWPVPLIEAVFLPYFKVLTDISKRYKIIEPVAKGAFGNVYKVWKEESQQFYAMKILSKAKILDENCVAQVKDEVKIHTVCGHHPFIIDSAQYWQDRSRLYIVSSFMDGGDLFNLTEKYGALPEDIVRLYIAELASAIDFLHNAGVIFRDLKAENVLLDSNLHAVVADFGLSKWLRYGERTSTICGTLIYMAPEVFSLQGYGHAVDWWSLGILTHFLLTNKYPSAGNTNQPGQLTDDRKELSVGALDLITRLLQVNPTNRLRNFLTLRTLKFFHGFNIDKIKSKQINPRELLEHHFPVNNVVEEKNNPEMVQSEIVFFDFDQYTPTIV
uniref:Putative catalytic domain of agc family protein serine/threonine kinase n=1 Tax=Triatoma infestans TaxID=30076 RepID=A0A023F0X3_TRIIF